MSEPERDEHSGIETTGHEWDGIRELDNPLPRWWLWIFYGCIFVAVVYWVLMPAWPGLNGYTPGVLKQSDRADVAEQLSALRVQRGRGEAMLATVPPEVRRWEPLARAQYLEFHTLLSGYLLSAQGDRMLMSNSVEGRFPFLDHRLIELSATLPRRFKLNGLDEKFILKRLAKGRVPAAVLSRPKFPYRAPVAEALVGPSAPGWSQDLLSAGAVDAGGVFEGVKVEKLVAKLRAAKGVPSEADAMALMAVASTQLLWQQFVRAPRSVPRAHLDAVEVT
jgi:asparagine synthetase B (glutamine-hydrolysing)